jgi:polysaccharide biosynthesis protein PslH
MDGASEADVAGALEFCDRVIALPSTGRFQLPAHGWRNFLMRGVAHLHWERLFELLFGFVNVYGIHWMRGTPAQGHFIQEVTASSAWDIIIYENVGSLELVADTAGIPSVITLFDVQSVVYKRLRDLSPWSWEDYLFYIPELLKIRQHEKRHYSRFDAAITVSKHDETLINQLCSELPTAVIDNGVDTAYYQPCIGSETANYLAFVGGYNYPPNRDAVFYFTEKIFPQVKSAIPSAVFLLVGKDAPAELERNPGVKAIGTVPDVRPYLHQASVIVVPLRAGSGTRIKILEALAAGKPVVTTSVGMEGLNVEDGRHLLVADSPEEFAKAVVSLLNNPGLRHRLGASGRKLVEQEYEWTNLTQRFERVLSTAVEKHERAS